MPRVLTSFDDYDSWGQYRPVHGDWEDREREAELEDRGRFRVRPLLRCPTCFKPIAAMKDCAACGDEDIEADTGDILPNGELNDGMAA